MSTPESIKPHEQKYYANAWDEYTLAELGWWVHLLAKRSSHRTDKDKKCKDIQDAQNYLSMMQAKLDGLKEKQ